MQQLKAFPVIWNSKKLSSWIRICKFCELHDEDYQQIFQIANGWKRSNKTMKNFVLPTLNIACSFLIQVIDFLLKDVIDFPLKSVVALTKNLEKTFIFTTWINISLFIKYLELQDNRKKPVSINFWLVFRVKWFRYYFPLKITRRCCFLILKNFLGSSLSI